VRLIGWLALLVARRAVTAPQLLAIRFVGVLMAVTLVAGVSLYSGAMGDSMLRQRLATDPSDVNLSISQTTQPLSNASYAALDTYIRHGESADIGAPLTGLHIHHNTSALPVYHLTPDGRRLVGARLATLALDYYEGLQGQIVLLAGTIDAPARMPNDDAPVVVSTYTARSLNLHVGDRLAFATDGSTAIGPPLRITGIFAPINPNSAFWDVHAGDPTYRSFVTPRLATFQSFAARGAVVGAEYFWLQQTNATALHLNSIDTTLNGLARARGRVAAIARGTVLITSLDTAINGFIDQYALLPAILLILVAPIVALILYAVTVTTTLALDRQAGEVVLMRSRGATRPQIFALYAAEGLVFGVIAMIVGPLIGLPLAGLIGRASGFLAFNGGLPFTPRLLPETYLYCGATALLCVLAGLLPAMAMARRSMMAFKGEQARPRGRPLWQRLYLDVVALAVALYGLALLVRQGVVSSGDATAAVAQDPAVAVTPLLFAVALMLLLSRLLPWLASLALHLLNPLLSPSALVALQSVSRAPRQPMRLVQLSTLTLTLGIFAATVAGVEAQNLADQYLYQAGAPLRLTESFDRQHVPASMKATPDIMPLAAHRALPGVRAVTPALRYDSFGNVTNTTDSGTIINVLGIDPATAGSVMWYRQDFGNQPFSQLLSDVQTPSPNAIVSDALTRATGLHQGDTFGATLNNNVHVSFRVAGVTRYFPSLNPSDAPFVVANVQYLEQASKAHGPNEVWLQMDQSQAAIDRIVYLAHQWPRAVQSVQGLAPADAAQNNPLSSGIYGVVSVGFLIAAALALLGFLTYAYLTLQQRLSEVDILRALGLSRGQVRTLLLFEQVFLLATAILGGIVAGVLTTRLFLPYMPIAANVVPPFLVVMPWSAVGAFVLAMLIAFVLVLSVHVTLLLRVQLGRVLRLGEG